MSALPKTIEGTWEEISRYSRELLGHRLRVTVLDDEPNLVDHPGFDTSPAAIEAWISRLQDWANSRPPMTSFANDSRDAIYAGRLDLP